MSRAHPWDDVMMRAAEREMAKQRITIADAVEDDYHAMPEPRDTGLLLASLEFGPTGPGPYDIRFAVDEEPQASYGAWQNEGIGEFGPLGRAITPVSAGVHALSWLAKDGVRVFRRSVRGTGRHIGWWDRWRDVQVPRVVARAWQKVGR